MTTFRILDQSPVYFDLAGDLASGGALKFYSTGTTTPKDVYADPDKSVNNGSTVEIDTDGRAKVDIWGDGAYRVRLYDANDTLISEADDVEIPGGTGTSIPALASGQFLTNDGSVLAWDSVRQVPDPTGSADKILGTDGTNLVWQAAPVAPTAPITTATDSVQFGTTAGKAWLIQKGTATGPASGTYTITKAVTFPTAYAAVPFVSICVETSYSGGPVVWYFASAPTTTGFSVTFDVAEGNSSQSTMNSDVPFAWLAQGTISV
jgi:hypothetical protein